MDRCQQKPNVKKVDAFNQGRVRECHSPTQRFGGQRAGKGAYKYFNWKGKHLKDCFV